MNVKNKAHRAQASVFSLSWCCTHLGLSPAVYETASFRYKAREESFPACSLLFTALTLSKADFQGEALISDLCTGLLVVHLQCVLLSQLTKVQGVCAAWDMLCLHLAHKQSVLLGQQCACLPAVLARQGQGTGVECLAWGGTGFLWCSVCQQVKRVKPAWASWQDAFNHSDVIVCRMHKHMQMTTACCSWRRRQRQR